MEDPTWVERWWLAMAVAMHRAVFVGGLEEAMGAEQKSRTHGGQPSLCTHRAGASRTDRSCGQKSCRRATWCVSPVPRRLLVRRSEHLLYGCIHARGAVVLTSGEPVLRS